MPFRLLRYFLAFCVAFATKFRSSRLSGVKFRYMRPVRLSLWLRRGRREGEGEGAGGYSDVDRAKVKITLYFNFMRQCTVRRRVGRFMTKFAYKQLIKCRAKHLLCFCCCFYCCFCFRFKNENYFGKCLPKLIAYTQRAPSNFMGRLCRRLCFFFLPPLFYSFALSFSLSLLAAISFAKIFLVSALKFH